MTDLDRLRQRAAKKKLPSMDRHVIVCVDDDCDDSGKITKRLKKGIAAAGLRTSVTTTKAKCLNICKGGPIVVVYPEGTWYAGVTGAVADRIVEEHLRDGQPVEEHTFLQNGLCATRLVQSA